MCIRDRNKGKYRTAYFTDNLCHELLRYCMEIECSAGVIFSGRENGKAITPGEMCIRDSQYPEWYGTYEVRKCGNSF